MMRSTSPPEAEVWGTFGGFRKYRAAHGFREPALNELGPKALVTRFVD